MSTALPSQAGTCKITGRVLWGVADGTDSDVNADGIPATGWVRFRPTVPPGTVFRVPAAGDLLIVPEIAYQLDADGRLVDQTGAAGVSVVASNDPDIQPNGWSYEVVFDTVPPCESLIIEAPAGGTVNLASAASVPVSGGGYVTAQVVDDLVDDVAALQTSVAGKLSKSGDTMTGDLTVSKAAPKVTLEGLSPRFDWKHPSAPSGFRWVRATLNSNGSWALDRYDDNETYVATVIGIAGNNVVTFAREVGVGSPSASGHASRISDITPLAATGLYYRDGDVCGYTGARALDSLVGSGWAPWVGSGSTVELNPTIERRGDQVTMAGFVVAQSGGGTGNVFTLPVGWRPARTQIVTTPTDSGSIQLRIQQAGIVRVIGSVPAGQSMSISHTWTTDNAPPTSLLGSPVTPQKTTLT